MDLKTKKFKTTNDMCDALKSALVLTTAEDEDTVINNALAIYFTLLDGVLSNPVKECYLIQDGEPIGKIKIDLKKELISDSGD